MKYKEIVYREILNEYEWKTPTQIKKQTEKRVGKSINWYSIRYILEQLLKEGKARKEETKSTSIWKRVGKIKK